MPYERQIHQDKALEGISVAYRPGEFIAERLIPTVKVKHETDKYYIYSTDIMSLEQTIRANGAEANQIQFNMSTSTYALQEHALKGIVTDRDRNNADKPINADIDMTEVITRKILIRKEVECAALVQDPATWSNTISVSSDMAFSANTTLSNPITQIDSGTAKIIGSSGYVPNKLVIDDGTFRSLKAHTSITDRVKYTSADSITEQMLAKLFDIAELVVGRAVYETAAEGIASSMGWIWTNMAWLAYVEPNPGLKKASAAYQLLQENTGSPYTVKRWRAEERNGDWIEVSSLFKMKAIATACAYLWEDTT